MHLRALTAATSLEVHPTLRLGRSFGLKRRRQGLKVSCHTVDLSSHGASADQLQKVTEVIKLIIVALLGFRGAATSGRLNSRRFKTYELKKVGRCHATLWLADPCPSLGVLRTSWVDGTH